MDMAMTTHEDAVRPVAAADRAIDLVHLARVTFGDRSLEREVLQLFDRQSCLLLARMCNASVTAIRPLAHTLKGSACGIGAKRVARAAEAVEIAVPDESKLKVALADLATATEEVRKVIADLLRAH
jgi:hypothetical protein